MSFSGMRDLSVRCGFSLPTDANRGAASRWSAPADSDRGATAIAPLLIVNDESHRLSLGRLLSSRACLRFAGCVQFAMKEYGRSRNFQRTANSVLTVCVSSGDKRNSSRLVILRRKRVACPEAFQFLEDLRNATLGDFRDDLSHLRVYGFVVGRSRCRDAQINSTQQLRIRFHIVMDTRPIAKQLLHPASPIA